MDNVEGNRMRPYILITTCCLALAGCAGGGGNGGGGNVDGGGGNVDGGGGSVDFSNPTVIGPGEPLPENFDGALQIAGTAVGAEFSVANDAAGIDSLTSAQSAELLASADTNGNGPDALRATTGGETIEVSASDGESILSGRAEIIGGEDGDTLFILPDDDLEFLAFGGWAETTGPDGSPATGDNVNFGAFGGPTPVGDRPTGDATYNGESLGITDSGGALEVTASDVTVTVTNNFSDVNFQSTNTIAENPETEDVRPAGELNFSATGSITNDGYTATGDGMTVTGDFFGSSGQETGGVFTGQRAGGDYIGAFGAAD